MSSSSFTKFWFHDIKKTSKHGLCRKSINMISHQKAGKNTLFTNNNMYRTITFVLFYTSIISLEWYLLTFFTCYKQKKMWKNSDQIARRNKSLTIFSIFHDFIVIFLINILNIKIIKIYVKSLKFIYKWCFVTYSEIPENYKFLSITNFHGKN